MDYTIVLSGSSKKLTVIKLRDWDSWEWDDFNTVKEKATDNIKWFDSEVEAIEFMFENFDHSIIEEEYFKNYSNDRKYYFK